MRTLDDIQREHAEWLKHNFPNSTGWYALVGATEELGELAHHFLKSQQGIRNNEDHAEGMRDSIGDVIIYLMHFCSEHDWNLSQVINETWAQVKKRDWQAHADNGVDS